ncbi:MAG TPA: phosphodiester glycosidase family protein, partial [Thermoanaerobaculia bacterium]|nr:phosphodiester glycosidase family protein [Thermoanaerobaculia bacterium]
ARDAINLDGGGSTAMWVGDKLVNRPSDGVERRVGNHLAVVLSSDYVGCPPAPPATQISSTSTTPAATGTTATTTTSTAPPR